MHEEAKRTIQSAGDTARERSYDEAVKAVWSNKEIIAPVLKFVISEFRNYEVKDIIRFIDADTISEDIPVDDIAPTMIDRGTESSSLGEKQLFYDIRFDAKNPNLSGKNLRVMLHVDFELQNDYKPSEKEGNRTITYPITKRGIYYMARMISQQLGRISGVKNYAALEKVYSIWVCMENIPDPLKNTVTSYRFQKHDMIGVCEEPEKEYDLAEMIIIRCGGNPKPGVFEYIDSVFSADLEKLEEYSDLKDQPGILEEVRKMGGFGHHIAVTNYERGRDEEHVNTMIEKERADAERERADSEKERADAERERADRLDEQLTDAKSHFDAAQKRIQELEQIVAELKEKR
mgnify:CR=1 FL=1